MTLTNAARDARTMPCPARHPPEKACGAQSTTFFGACNILVAADGPRHDAKARTLLVRPDRCLRITTLKSSRVVNHDIAEVLEPKEKLQRFGRDPLQLGRTILVRNVLANEVDEFGRSFSVLARFRLG